MSMGEMTRSMEARTAASYMLGLGGQGRGVGLNNLILDYFADSGVWGGDGVGVRWVFLFCFVLSPIWVESRQEWRGVGVTNLVNFSA